MDLREIWDILDVSETKDEDLITQAYRKKLVFVNPEDDAEGFMRLREAYEKAILTANELELGSDESTDREKNDVDLWIDKVDAVYSSIESRRNEESWKELFSDDICIELDTSIEAREKLLGFLMDHSFLPYEIWQMIESEFNIISSKEQLYEIFPKNFINYIINQISVEGFLDYNLFRIMDEGSEGVDEFIKTYFTLKSKIEEKQLDECPKLMEQLDSYAIYHPYKDVEKARYHLLRDEISEATTIADHIISWYPDDIYVLSLYGTIKNKQEDYDASYELFQQILDQYPDYYIAKLGMIECLYNIKEYTKAKELVIDLVDIYRGNETAHEYLIKINESLISQFREDIKDKEDYKTQIEIAWCLFQNQKSEECISILEELPEEARREYDYINLHGRAYLSLDKYDLAIDKLKLWVDAILETKKDDSDESNKRYRRLSNAYYSIGFCYASLESYDEAITYFKKSIEVEEEAYDKLMAMERLAYTYLQIGNFEETIDTCDKIIDISSDYYPAYLHRQQACYEMGRDQEVINDYHRAIEIYPAAIKPYLFAIKVYLRHNQFEDAKLVEKTVKENGLHSNEFELLCIRILRQTADSNRKREEAIDRCRKLKFKLESEDNDIKDPVTLDYEMVLLYASLNQYDMALHLIDLIIEKKPKESFYLYIKGVLLKDFRKYNEAINVFNGLLIDEPNNERIYYELGYCYLKINDMETALEKFQKTLDINPSFSDANDKIVDIYRDMFNRRKKMDYYTKALPYADKQLEVNESEYYYVSRGLLHLDAYEFEKALDDFYRALELNPKNWAALNNAGYTNMLIRSMDIAINELMQVVEDISIEKSKLPYSNLAKAYYILKNYDEALKYYTMLHQAYPNEAEYIANISNIYKDKFDLDLSIEWINKLSKFSDYDEDKIKANLADIYFLKEKVFKANKYYLSSLGRHNADNYMGYAEFLVFNKRFRYALIIMNKARKLSNLDEETYIDVYGRSAVLYWNIILFSKRLSRSKRSKYEKEAKSLADLAIQKICELYENVDKYYEYPASRTEHLVYLATIYLSMGENDRAEHFLSLALNTSPCTKCIYRKCVRLYEIYGMLYEIRGQMDKAIECYEIISDQDPSDMSYIKRLKNARDKHKA